MRKFALVVGLLMIASLGWAQTTYRGGTGTTAAADSSYDSLYTAKLRIGTLAGTLRSTNGASVTATASDTVGLAAALAAKQASASLADSMRVHGIGSSLNAAGQVVFSGATDSIYSVTGYTKAAIGMKFDTLAIFVFGAGGAQAGDTSAFSTSTIYGSFVTGTTDTLVITKLLIHTQGTADTISVDVIWSDSLKDVTHTHLNTTPSPAGSLSASHSTGVAVTSFTNTKIPPNSIVWCETPTVVAAKKPTYLSATIIGYRLRHY
jgi:hypothetical protein